MRYRFIVREELGKLYATTFEEAMLTVTEGFTHIELDVRDTSHLYGVIEQIERLGLRLVSVQPVEGDATPVC